ncbi:MAG: DNA repair protein RecN [candidate division WOR-3 bacterium]|nr:MAG: DNA repair protein RecN [candidate division WOR-3 bacterium]
MLKLLRVQNFALMEDLTVDFDKGLTVVTGETGAGKSMIVEAIATLCGERMEDISIRSDKSFAEVAGVFDATPSLRARLRESGIEINSDLIIRRKIERGKRQSSYINDQIVSLNLLKELTKEIIDLVGQYENQSLFYAKNHLSLYDTYAGISDLKNDYAVNFHEYRRLQNKLEHLLESMRQKDEKLDYLKYQINEIEKAHLQEGEEENLLIEKDLLLSSEKRSSLSGEIVSTLYEAEESVIERVSKVKKIIEELSSLDRGVHGLNENINQVITTIDDIYRELSSYHDKIEFSQERLDAVLERLELIHKIKKKYGKTIEEISNYLENIKKELSHIETSDEEIRDIKARLVEVEKKVIEQAGMLSTHRHNTSASFQKKILELVSQLGMEKADFDITFREKDLDEDGKDEIEFYISTNPGEELKPLHKIASGGEISRITLCLKTLLSDVDKIPTVIFDEVDTGIGGRIAEAVGELLATVSQRHQIICITHLPQISVFADYHMLVQKEIKGKKTFTYVKKLDEESRKLEIARMLGGKEITKKTVEHAAEILKKIKKR